jgi:hypothetical protein
LLADFGEFFHSHCAHGSLTANDTEPACNGYLLTVACSCGVVLGGGRRPRMPTLTF